MLMQELFRRGVMRMGPAPDDPGRQVGVFNPDVVGGMRGLRARAMEIVKWLEGEWDYENEVPAGPSHPAYVDRGKLTFFLGEKGNWLCLAGADGSAKKQMTFDPFSGQWIYVLCEGSYGILRSSEGWVEDSIRFTGVMTMLGVTCEWRMTWTKHNAESFSFVNEERDEAGAWNEIDVWRLCREGAAR